MPTVARSTGLSGMMKVGKHVERDMSGPAPIGRFWTAAAALALKRLTFSIVSSYSLLLPSVKL
jgi:hypothetical protein